MKRPTALTPAALRRIPLPEPHAAADKESRGRVLLVGGSRENPGGLLLAAEAVLRAGAGKLQVATVESIALAVGMAMPEARVFALPEAGPGGPGAFAAGAVVERATRAGAVLLGPGMVDEEAAAALAAGVLAELRGVGVVLDAGALAVLRHHAGALRQLAAGAVLTPHAGEMAQLMEMERAEVEAEPEATARRAAERFGATVALKGAVTHVAARDGAVFRYSGGGVGLATSGSGDVLAGLVAGLLARGAAPERAAAWGVWLHGEAGNVLARRRGPLGFLARELAPEVPALLARAGRARGIGGQARSRVSGHRIRPLPRENRS